MTIFNWSYFSFVNTDWTWVQRELLIIPVLVLILWVGWMKMVRSALVDEQVQILESAKTFTAFSDDEGAVNSQDDDESSSDEEDDESKAKKADLNEPAEDKKNM